MTSFYWPARLTISTARSRRLPRRSDRKARFYRCSTGSITSRPDGSLRRPSGAGGMSLVRAELSPEGDIIRPEGSGLGETSYGELNRERSARSEAIPTALAAGFVASTISDDILAEMWAKFCGFAAAATIAALTRARAGEIASASAGATFVASVFKECASGHGSRGISDTAGNGGPRSRNVRPRRLDLWPLDPMDLENGRRTEGAHTVGDIVRRADRHGLEVPLLRRLYAICRSTRRERARPPSR